MYAFIPWNPSALPQWEEALRLAAAGVPPREIVRRTGIKRSTFFQRMERRRAIMDRRPQPMAT